MALPWVRLDAAIGSHDKILALISDPSPKRWQAVSSYMFALGWSGSHGTDGRIPTAALPFVHATAATARLLVKHQLWDESLTGWTIRNWDKRQVSTDVASDIETKRAHGAAKGGCVKNHGPGCWRNGRCSRAA